MVITEGEIVQVKKKSKQRSHSISISDGRTLSLSSSEDQKSGAVNNSLAEKGKMMSDEN